MNAETGMINFDNFAAIASYFLEDEDDEAMQNELREAFRMYDKEGPLKPYRRSIAHLKGFLGYNTTCVKHRTGNGFITTKTLREILAALDDKLTQEDLDGMIEEIDAEGHGKVDVEGTSTKPSS